MDNRILMHMHSYDPPARSPLPQRIKYYQLRRSRKLSLEIPVRVHRVFFFFLFFFVFIIIFCPRYGVRYLSALLQHTISMSFDLLFLSSSIHSRTSVAAHTLPPPLLFQNHESKTTIQTKPDQETPKRYLKAS
jgi:uncharacterized protein with PQ loop repeat